MSHDQSAMRVAMVIERYDPRRGGAERSTAQIAEHLVERGHEVTILTGYAPSDMVSNGVAVEAMSSHRSSTWVRELAFAKWAERRLAQGQFDTTLSLTTAVPARVVQPRAGIVRVAQSRAIARRRSPWARLVKRLLIGLSAKQWVLRRLESTTLRHSGVHRFVAISRYMAQQTERCHGFDQEKLSIIANGAQMPAASERQRRQQRRKLRCALRIGDKTPVYLFSAYDPWRKGVRPLFEAVQRLIEQDVDLLLLITGCFTYQYRLNRLAAQLGIRRVVRFLGPTRHMAQAYAAADVTVLPSYYDPCSRVVIESLLMGTPAITSAHNGAAEFVLDPAGDHRGRVIENPDDVAALADAMRELADAGVRAKCRHAIQKIEHELTMGRHVDELECVLIESAGR